MIDVESRVRFHDVHQSLAVLPYLLPCRHSRGRCRSHSSWNSGAIVFARSIGFTGYSVVAQVRLEGLVYSRLCEATLAGVWVRSTVVPVRDRGPEAPTDVR